jgi:hypothetical protein
VSSSRASRSISTSTIFCTAARCLQAAEYNTQVSTSVVLMAPYLSRSSLSVSNTSRILLSTLSSMATAVSLPTWTASKKSRIETTLRKSRGRPLALARGQYGGKSRPSGTTLGRGAYDAPVRSPPSITKILRGLAGAIPGSLSSRQSLEGGAGPDHRGHRPAT